MALSEARDRCAAFIASTADGPDAFRLTPRSEPTPYARCFAIFGYHLLRDCARIRAGADRWAEAIRRDLEALRAARRAAGAALDRDKPYLHLLTFSLSALHILDRLEADPLEDHVMAVVPTDVARLFRETDVLAGAPRSGNQAMFMAILLLHARDRLGRDDRGQLQAWQELLLRGMNRCGFWGSDKSMSHLQFQNGYHQYEIFEYLETSGVPWQTAADAVASLGDARGHFAPYPGGGGCYDYDAVFLITGAGAETAARHRGLLDRTRASILEEQNADGGFGESRCVRPRSAANVMRAVRHVAAARGAARVERARYNLTLLRPRHDRIHTHWSRYSREWGESDLWDAWFRMLAVARIQVAFEPARAAEWGFVDYPGIGFHPSARAAHR